MDKLQNQAMARYERMERLADAASDMTHAEMDQAHCLLMAEGHHKAAVLLVRAADIKSIDQIIEAEQGREWTPQEVNVS